MEFTSFLSKVVGLTFLVVGLAIILRRRELVPVFAGYVEQRLLRFTLSMIELAAGLALALNDAWSPLPAAVMTLLGWMAVTEALFFMLAPDALVAWLMDGFNTEGWYLVGGGLAIAVGFYLAGFGFGYW